ADLPGCPLTSPFRTRPAEVNRGGHAPTRCSTACTPVCPVYRRAASHRHRPPAVGTLVVMAVTISPKQLPPVLLSREAGKNAVRHAVSTGHVQVARGVFVDPLDEDDPPWRQAEHLALARSVGVVRRTAARPVFSRRTAALLHG